MRPRALLWHSPELAHVPAVSKRNRIMNGKQQQTLQRRRMKPLPGGVGVWTTKNYSAITFRTFLAFSMLAGSGWFDPITLSTCLKSKHQKEKIRLHTIIHSAAWDCSLPPLRECQCEVFVYPLQSFSPCHFGMKECPSLIDSLCSLYLFLNLLNCHHVALTS